MFSGSRINTTRTLRSIWLNQGITRIQISDQLGLNKSTVTKIVSDLEALGIVETASIGDAGPAGGRRPIHLRVKANWGCVMGVEMQTEAFTVVGINLHGDIFFSHTEPLDIRKSTLVSAFVDIVNRFRTSLERTGLPLIGIGVGLPGFVDPVTGVLRASKPLELYEPIEFVREAQAALQTAIPIMIDNDANCGCWGEVAFRHTNRPENFLFVLGEQRKHTVEMDDYRIMALGLGLFLNGRVHHGHECSAGEFRSILYQSSRVNQFSIEDDEARRFLHDPEVDARIVRELSDHIAFLVHVLNLNKVVIGGPVELLADQMIEAIWHRIEENWAYPNRVACEVSVSRLGEQAVAYGAAEMFLEHLITVPDVGAEREMATCGIDLIDPDR